MHTVHTDDCMSELAESRRAIMTPETVAENHRLHMGDLDRPRSARVYRAHCSECGKNHALTPVKLVMHPHGVPRCLGSGNPPRPGTAYWLPRK